MKLEKLNLSLLREKFWVLLPHPLYQSKQLKKASKLTFTLILILISQIVNSVVKHTTKGNALLMERCATGVVIRTISNQNAYPVRDLNPTQKGQGKPKAKANSLASVTSVVTPKRSIA